MSVRRRRRAWRCFQWVTSFSVLIFLLVPVFIVIPLSFNPGTVLHFPPKGLSLRWYRDFFGDERWIEAAWLSVRVGVLVAIVATVLGLATAVALTRHITRGAGLLRAVVLSPVVVPLIITAIAVFEIFQRTNLTRNFFGLVLAHTILAVPYSVVILESALRNYDQAPEEVAMSLGASRWTAFRKVTMPINAPAIQASVLFAFLLSWDEVVMVLFLGGARFQTLPLRMFEFLETQIRPTIAAVSSLIIYALFAGAATLWYLDRRRRLPSRGLLETADRGPRD